MVQYLLTSGKRCNRCDRETGGRADALVTAWPRWRVRAGWRSTARRFLLLQRLHATIEGTGADARVSMLATTRGWNLRAPSAPASRRDAASRGTSEVSHAARAAIRSTLDRVIHDGHGARWRRRPGGRSDRATGGDRDRGVRPRQRLEPAQPAQPDRRTVARERRLCDVAVRSVDTTRKPRSATRVTSGSTSRCSRPG